jgi:hypothetical protein
MRSKISAAVASAILFPAPLHELLALLGHLLGLLFAHGPAQQVRAAEGVVGDDPCAAHDLFLVDDDAVGGLQRLLQGRMRVGDFDLPVLALDEFVHHAGAQRPWPVQGEHGDDVLEAGGLEHPQILAHSAGFHLEDAVGVAGAENFVGGGVVEGQGFQVWPGLARALDDVERVLTTVMVRRPRKSNLMRPTFSTSFMSYWVTISPSFPLYKGR